MRKFLRAIVRRSGPGNDVWPVAFVCLAVLVPALFVIWFMKVAMSNERLAVREQLSVICRGQLELSRARMEYRWSERAAELDRIAQSNAPAAAFALSVESGIFESVILLDGNGDASYPSARTLNSVPRIEPDSEWSRANQTEYSQKDFKAAAILYAQIAATATSLHLAARALQAQARCLVRAGQKETALKLITEQLGAPRYEQALDAQGRLIAANAELMVLELCDDHGADVFRTTLARLKKRVMDYDNPVFASAQRRFLMNEIQRIVHGEAVFPTLQAEEIAASISKPRTLLTPASSLRASPISNLWFFITPNHSAIAFVNSNKIAASLGATLAHIKSLADAELKLISPGHEFSDGFASIPAGQWLPDWRIGLSFKGPNVFTAAVVDRNTLYVWTATIGLSLMGILAFAASRMIRRQLEVARLKSDLAATVSHELKTPLASMRVLVDTLVDAEQFDPTTAREYLELISRENERLTRLIHNFLTFSRMQKTSAALRLEPIAVENLVQSAVNVMRQRFEACTCSLETELPPELPTLMIDVDAMTTALVNLLDNACKFCGAPGHVILATQQIGNNILISVTDNGCGIAPRELKKIFRPFYQSDHRLSRTTSGVGLGLSIVESIVHAHGGNVSVESHLGKGSTFAISLPVATATSSRRESAVVSTIQNVVNERRVRASE